jgi:Cu(I)/Ag(I) efflux system membrane fusion protein
VTAQSEFILAAKNQSQSTSLLEATEDRLRNMGLSDAQVAKLKRTLAPEREILVRSPISGTILDVAASEGSSVANGQTVVVVGDLDKSYIVDIRIGQKITFTVPNISSEEQEGAVDLVYPQVEGGSGTANVRLHSKKYSSDLKPGVYVDVRFPISMGKRLTIPADALLYSGLHNYVFVDRGAGNLEPREVFPGRFVGDQVEIRAGLTSGERVVASGNFLLSSEAQLRSALPKWKAAGEM